MLPTASGRKLFNFPHQLSWCATRAANPGSDRLAGLQVYSKATVVAAGAGNSQLLGNLQVATLRSSAVISSTRSIGRSFAIWAWKALAGATAHPRNGFRITSYCSAALPWHFPQLNHNRSFGLGLRRAQLDHVLLQRAEEAGATIRTEAASPADFKTVVAMAVGHGRGRSWRARSSAPMDATLGLPNSSA